MFRAMPVMRDVERIELPSTRAATTAVRSALLRTFAILSIMLDRIKKSGCTAKETPPFGGALESL